MFGILRCRITKERSATYRKLKLRKDIITIINKMFEIWSKTSPINQFFEPKRDTKVVQFVF